MFMYTLCKIYHIILKIRRGVTPRYFRTTPTLLFTRVVWLWILDIVLNNRKKQQIVTYYFQCVCCFYWSERKQQNHKTREQAASPSIEQASKSALTKTEVNWYSPHPVRLHFLLLFLPHLRVLTFTIHFVSNTY